MKTKRKNGDDRWGRIKEVMKEHELYPMWKPEHTASLYFKEQVLQTTKQTPTCAR